VIKPIEHDVKPPAGLKPLTQLPLNEVTLSGEIVRQSLFPREDVLLHQFDLRVTVAWRSARSTVDLVAFKTAQVRLVDTFAVPKSNCVLAILSALGKPEETGYELQKPVLLCAKKIEAVSPGKTNKTLRNP
jgi:hypothetical protein